MPYTRFHEAWENLPSTDTPITAAALDHIEDGIFTARDYADAALSQSSVNNGEIVAHLIDNVDAHDASDISVDASGFGGQLSTGDDNVQKVAEKVDALVIAAGDLDVTDLQAAYVNGQKWEQQVMATPPTLALSAASAATGISGGTTTAPNDSVFTYLGAVMENVGTLNTFPNCYRQDDATLTDSVDQCLLNAEFETDADTFEIVVRSESTLDAKIRVWVNGELASAAPQAVGTSGSWFRYRVTFTASAARRIRVEGQYVTFYGVTKHPTRTLWRTTRNTGPKAVIVGDSYMLNISGSSTPGVFLDRPWVWDSWGVRAGRYLGWNVYPSAVSGTGYLATDTGTEANYGDRFATDVEALDPEIVVFSGGLNDQGLTLATIETEINALFAACAAALPTARVYCLDPFSPRDTYDTNLSTIAGYIGAAAADNGFTQIAGCVNWITGTGYAGATTGNGNSDYYTAPDGYHPTAAAGYPYLAERFVGALGVNVGRHAAPSSGSAGTIADGSITYAKLQNVTMGTILGQSGTTGPVDELSAADVAGLVGGTSSGTLALGNHAHSGVYATASHTHTGSQTRLQHDAGYTLTVATPTYLPWNDEQFDDLAGHNDVSANTKFVIPATGRYRFTAWIGGYIASGSNRAILGEFMVNRTDTLGATSGVANGDGWAAYVLDSGWRQFTIGDEVELRAEAKGGDATTYANTLWMCAERVS